MEANSKFGNFSDEERGLVGIGTLIIFIALILTAAVAAGVIIQTSGDLRDQALQTGRQAIREVSTGFRVVNSQGAVFENDYVENAEIVTALRAGSDGIDFTDVIVSYTSDEESQHLEHGATYPYKDNINPDPGGDFDPASEFAVVKVSSRDYENRVGSTGEKASIWIYPENIGDPIYPDEEADVMIMPKVGTETRLTLMAPPAFNDEDYVRL